MVITNNNGRVVVVTVEQDCPFTDVLVFVHQHESLVTTGSYHIVDGINDFATRKLIQQYHMVIVAVLSEQAGRAGQRVPFPDRRRQRTAERALYVT